MKYIYYTLLLLFFGVFTINAQQQNTLQNQGNVGIGTTSPTKSLEVVGESEIHGKLSIDSTLLVKDTALFERNVSFSENFEVYGEGIIREDLRIDGNLEVGGATVLEKGLNVYENINFFDLENLQSLEEEELLIVTSTGALKTLRFEAVEAEMYLPKICFTDMNGNIPNPMWKNGTNKIFTDCPEINVGIGNDNPQSRLHVSGRTRTQGLHAGTFVDNSSTLSAYRVGPNTSNASIVKIGRTLNNDVQTYFDLQLDGKLRMQNETRDVFLVDVDGETVYARRIVVDQEVWPDYVFEENYKLMPLNEVKSYIQKHGHLPNVPSAKEVEEKGVDLGEMNKILLEKIEELTLYTLEQQKELNDLKEKLNQLLEE